MEAMVLRPLSSEGASGASRIFPLHLPSDAEAGVCLAYHLPPYSRPFLFAIVIRDHVIATPHTQRPHRDRQSVPCGRSVLSEPASTASPVHLLSPTGVSGKHPSI